MSMTTTRCPHCDSMNRLPIARINANPNCGRCKMPLLLGKPIEGTLINFDSLVKGDLPIVVDFWAPWCSPCTNFSPIFEQLATQETGVRFVKINTETQSQLAAQYNIRSIPTLMLFKNGNVIDTLNGALPKAQFKTWLAQAILK